MLLLSNMLQLDDSLWEQRVRCGQYSRFPRLCYKLITSSDACNEIMLATHAVQSSSVQMGILISWLCSLGCHELTVT